MLLAKEQRERDEGLRASTAAAKPPSTREWQAEMRKAATGPAEEPPVDPRGLVSSAADDASILRVMTALSPIRKLPAVTLSKLKKLHQALHKKAVAGSFVRTTSDPALALVRWEQLFRRLDFDQNKHLDRDEFKRSLRGTMQISRREVMGDWFRPCSRSNLGRSEQRKNKYR
jgi:hypothetical protein